MAPKRLLSPSPPDYPSGLYRSSPIEDRSSRFIAIYSPGLSAKELQATAEFRTATHRIAAWRKPSSQRALSSQRLFHTGHDDDGEKNGGRALESLIASMDVEGAVVVARWYGGVMLGPVRFDHIKNCAREAITQSLHENEPISKKAKVVKDGQRKGELICILPERDQSIAVLRGLLAEKQQSAIPGKGIPAKAPDYTALPLPALENLERARDATIGWILGQIEKAETAQKESSTAPEPFFQDSPQVYDSENGSTATGNQRLVESTTALEKSHD